jgi:hypothetical protein
MPSGGRLTDHVTIGLLTSSVPRESVDEAIAAFGKQARRGDGSLPPHVVVYLVMMLALDSDSDYEECAVLLTETLALWGCWDTSWQTPTSGGITLARRRLGSEVMAELFRRVAVPVSSEMTVGAYLGRWLLVAMDGFDWDIPDTDANAREFGYGGSGENRSAFPKARVVTVSECASHAPLDCEIGPIRGKQTSEQALADALYGRLGEDWLLISDRGFYSYAAWAKACASGAALLWRVKSDLGLPRVGEILGDGSYLAVIVNPAVKGAARQHLVRDARAGKDLDPDKARVVRVVEYQVPDRVGDGNDELITLITSILDLRQAPAADLAQAYHERWESEGANKQIKAQLRGPGKIARSQSPDMVVQEIYGYLLTHYAISALICRAATRAQIDPDRVSFIKTVRIVRRRLSDPAAFSP